jgi:hypothetical protein
MSALTTAFRAPYVHFSAIALALVLLCFFFVIKRLSPYLRELRRKWNPPAPYDAVLIRFYRTAFLFWLVCLVPSLLLLSFSVYLTRYQWIGTKVELAGEVDYKHGVLELRSPAGRQQTFPVRGQKQAAAGILMQFPGWMRYLGLATYHQLVGFRSPEEQQFRYNKATPEYVDTISDRFFSFVYRNQSWLFIQAKYTESPYFTGSGHKIFITHSGYIVQ